MEYAKFKRLLQSGEGPTIDFKVSCDAFKAKNRAARAELAKDVCAMCNNGNVASFMVIGVSNDRKQFHSVQNPNLTDDALQDFCKKSISPPPRVKLERVRWTRADPQHAGKDFVIIQIGPQARHAFSLAQDFMLYEDRTCYRKNEVWIRRGATSDLATPEEACRLLKGQPPLESDDVGQSRMYDRLPRSEQRQAMLADLADLVQEIGGRMKEERLVMPLGGVQHVWRVRTVVDFSNELGWSGYRSSGWSYEHACLFLVQSSVTKSQLTHGGGAELRFRTSWGWYLHIPARLLPWGHEDVYWPQEKEQDRLRVPILIAHRLSSTAALRHSLLNILDFVQNDGDAVKRASVARARINQQLKAWVSAGDISGASASNQDTRSSLKHARAVLRLTG